MQLMNKARIDALSDGIFAIVMTLLVIEIKVPEVHFSGDKELLRAIIDLYPLFLSYVVSFAVLFTYWRGHNYIITVFANNIDNKLANYNAIFFLLVALIPFSSHFLGLYSDSVLGILIFGVNTVVIGLSLYGMRNYVYRAKSIDNEEFTDRDLRHGTIRILTPTISSAIAILVSFIDIKLALYLLTFAIIFNLVPKSADILDKTFFRAAHEQEKPVSPTRSSKKGSKK